MQLEAAGASDVGRVRSVNEDAYLTLPAAVVVADGMGGHACGEVASSLVVTAFESLRQSEQLTAQDIARTLHSGNEAILAEVVARPERQGMGTTVAGLAMVEEGGSPHWLVFNVGDSRVYRVEAGRLVQMTVDHSEVAELVAAGRVSPADARTHPLRNVVTRSLGTSPAPVADTWLVPAEPDDVFLVCSDGLTGELEDAEIAHLIAGAPSLRDAVDDLITAAVSAGGRDNVTAVLVTARSRRHETDLAQVTTQPRAQLQELRP